MRGKFNWPLWSGLALAAFAFLSYFLFFSRFPVTRDVPWVSYLLFLIAIALVVAGWRRAPRKVLASIAAGIGLLIFASFTHAVTIGSKVPASPGAPEVSERAPDFVLPDANGRTVSLASTLAGSNGVLLVFYRGYW